MDKQVKKDGEPCFFVVKKATAKEKARMAPICVACHEKHLWPQKKTGWYWDGGYGHKFDVICEACGKYIRKYNP
jgi:hypothetical protein